MPESSLVLPKDYAGRDQVLDLLRRHIRGLACYQSPLGFWHQLIDKNDSYVYAAHGYGPVLLAGAEMIDLLKKHFPKMNDSAIQFYKQEIKGNGAIFDAKKCN